MRSKRRRLLLICILFTVHTTIDAVVCADEDEGFHALFDGHTLTGWRGYQQPTPPDNWSVDNGQIRGDGRGPDLVSKATYSDFEFRFEWKLAPGGNSGVIYRASEAGERAHHTGPEYQIFDDSSIEEELAPLHSVGAIYGLYAAKQKPLREAGEYNTAKIIARGTHIEHWLNGELVAECEINSEDWKQKVAGSKFHAWPEFGELTEGHIVLQSHGSKVWYRNLRIKQLEAPAGP